MFQKKFMDYKETEPFRVGSVAFGSTDQTTDAEWKVNKDAGNVHSFIQLFIMTDVMQIPNSSNYDKKMEF